MKTAVIILGHGSKRPDAADSLRAVATSVRAAGVYDFVEHAYLQYASPAIRDSIEQCARNGAERVIIVPFFIQAGAHVSTDVPEIAREAQEQYPAVKIQVTEHLGSHPMLVDIVFDLIRKAT